ncbi:hypothetical protein SF83666_a46600 (plasmid) [Sinorhizobium fredii CCBAU 83666]|nr:hypothetical protein SF83666_a46600 [Sinorhizobium fredii CCBAU 83666]
MDVNDRAIEDVNLPTMYCPQALAVVRKQANFVSRHWPAVDDRFCDQIIVFN